MNRRGGPEWALVLSGGGAKGFAHIGVLSALEELGANRPSLIVGTSMGAIVGGLYASGMPVSEIEAFAAGFDIRRYLDGFSFQLPDGPLSRVFQTGQMIGNLATKPGIDSGRKILATLNELTGGKSFDQAVIPFRCNAVDLLTGREKILSSGSMATAMRASMAVPGFFEPVPIEGALLADGGLADNMPVRIAREAGFKRILAIDVWNFRTIESTALRNGPGILYRSFELAVAARDRGSADKATLTIAVDDGTSALDFARARRLVMLGKRKTMAAEPSLRALLGYSPLDALRRAFGT